MTVVGFSWTLPPVLQGVRRYLRSSRASEAILLFRLSDVSPALQGDALIKRLGSHAYPFHLELTPLAPPSVQLVPAKQYLGAPIGTSMTSEHIAKHYHGAPIGTFYDIRAYIADRSDEKVSRRNTVRMGIRVLQGPGRPAVPAVLPPPSPHHALHALAHHNVMRLKHKKLESDENCRPKKEGLDAELPPPRAAVEKPFLLSDGRVELEAWLDKATYSHGESISVSVIISNQSSKTVRRIKALVVQHVDVCMFSNGKFKNVVALVRGDGTVLSGQTYSGTYVLTPHRGVTKNWIALEDSYSKSGASLASTVVCSSNSPEERNVFAIYVSYYVKVKLTLSAMGGEVSVKLPFILTHSCINEAPTDSESEATLLFRLSDVTPRPSGCPFTVSKSTLKGSEGGALGTSHSSFPEPHGHGGSVGPPENPTPVILHPPVCPKLPTPFRASDATSYPLERPMLPPDLGTWAAKLSNDLMNLAEINKYT
ncbi:phosrestin-2 isoform X1 [Phthorimaea operculella]|nr:phosrestin-2 isoform X1 [Phthorimaea operculella]